MSRILLGMEQSEGTRGGEPQAQADVRRCQFGHPYAQGRTVKKVLGPSDKKQRAKYIQEAYSVCVTRSCGVLDLARSMWYYHSRRDDTQVIDALSKLAEELPTMGFEVYYKCLRREGRNWNRKRVLRV